MVSSEFIFWSLCIFFGVYKVFSLQLKQYFGEFRICYLKYVSHMWVSLSVIGILWLVLHIPAALIPRNELFLLQVGTTVMPPFF
jgi:hypothetical protein